MNRTSARAGDFPRDQLALCHARWAGGWQPTPPKPDILMSPAGGMFASGRDTARFIQLFATDGATARSRIPARTLRRTWAREIGNQQEFLGMQRDGYGLGWDLGTILGQPMVSRGGTFTGCRSVILFLPESGLGVVVLSNGDTAGHAHNEAILVQAVDLWTGPPGAAERGAQRIADYQARAARDTARVDARQSVLT